VTDKLIRHRQLARPDEFDDTLDESAVAGVESSAEDNADFINGVLSQLKRFLHGNDAGNWHDDPATIFGGDASMKALYEGGGGGGTAGGAIRIIGASVQSTGTISDEVYQDTGNTVLQSFTTSTVDITLSIRSSYPLVDVDGNLAELTIDGSGGFYSGDVDITISGSGNIIAKAITADDLDGATDTVAITLEEPPVLLTLAFTGEYPGSQTELKEDDNYGIAGTTDKAIDAIEVADWNAGQSEVITGLSGTSFSEQITVADRGTTPQLLPARVRARDAVTGAWGDWLDTNDGGGTTEGVHLVNCNNLYPSVSIGSVTYPGSQEALKNSESATVANTCSNFDTILYSDPTGTELNISNTTSYEASKSVTRVGGTYNISTTNFRIAATRAANDATTTENAVVYIANVAAQITVTEPAARLRSGGNDGTSVQDHSITLTSDQNLLSNPSLDEDTGGGTFTGSWAGGPTIYTRTLQVHDDDVKGTYNWQNLSATNLAGIVTTTITGGTDYELGGFVSRTLTFPAFSQETTLNVAVVDYTKIQAGIFTATSYAAVRHTPQGDHADAVNEYTIDSPLETNPQTLWWNDVTAASSNSSGTAAITDVEEVV
jgi:hypothetical protein